jgi:hypothetical protein
MLRFRLVVLAVFGLGAFMPHAMAQTRLSGDQRSMAFSVMAAIVANDNCHGFRLIEGSVEAKLNSVHLTKAQASGDEWLYIRDLAYKTAMELYREDSKYFCEYEYRSFGPDSDSPLLTKD